MLFLKHPAWIWVKKNDPTKIPPVDEATQAKFDAGHQFEAFVDTLYPEGVTIGFSFDDSSMNYWSMPERTKNAIERGDRLLFQPRFEWGNFTCICDIVSFVSDKEVDLIEVKASTSAKTEHEYDLAFQVAVLEGAGYKVRNISVIHVNNNFIKNGEILPEEISSETDVTIKVRAKAELTNKYMPMAYEVAQRAKMPDPNPEFAKLGSKYDWLEIYKNLVPIKLENSTETMEPTILKDKIKKFCDELVFPLYFLDYETMASLLPYFDGHKPYQQIPFQYSLHILETPDAKIAQKEYLHRDKTDPAPQLATQLIKDIGTTGSVIVWYQGFEKARNSEMGEMLPELKSKMEAINERVVDLMIPFKSKWYDDPRFEGSASIKKVLPVICPELSYKNLGIQEGGSAQRLWMEAVLDGKRDSEKDKIFSDLVEYCGLDTLAMVEIYRKLLAI